MTRSSMLFCAAVCAAAAPAALAGGHHGCAAPVVPGATVDLEFAGCPCAAGPTCGAPAGPCCDAPAYGYAPANCGCDNRNYAVLPGSGRGGIKGGLGRLWELEKRKNAWLKKTFFDGPRGKLCGLRDDCAPVCAPACAATCAAPVYGAADGFAPACDAGCGDVYGAAPAFAAPTCGAPCGDACGSVCEPGCAAPVAVPGCAAPAFAAPSCGCN